MSFNKLLFVGKAYRFFKSINIIKIVLISFLLYCVIFSLSKLNIEAFFFLNEIKYFSIIDITNFIFLFSSLFVIVKVLIMKFIEYKYIDCQIFNIKKEIKNLIINKNKLITEEI